MRPRSLIVLGASAGGIEALTRFVSELPDDLPAAVLVVVHVPSDSVSHLPAILTRAGALAAAHAEDGDTIEAGKLLVAPPDRHLIVENGVVRVPRGPRENRHRPAVDPLFRSAARWYGNRVIAVLLSGGAGDGKAGLREVKRRGGTTASARGAVEVDHVLPADEIGRLVSELATQREAETAPPPARLVFETAIAELDEAAVRGEDRPGVPSPYACPDCGGVLWEMDNGDLRFRCRVGHAYTAESLMEEQSAGLETILWSALRALEEKADLSRRMAARARSRGHAATEFRYRSHAEEAEQQAATVRDLLLRPEGLDRPGALSPLAEEADQKTG
jgi:two-component system, chemotaxis family, protein-glutamate methylesterase/glutaminase